RRLAFADAYPQVGGDPVVAVERPGYRAVRTRLGIQVALPVWNLKLRDGARDRPQEVLVDAMAGGLVLVAEEEVGVLPAVALVCRRLRTPESHLRLGIGIERVVAE